MLRDPSESAQLDPSLIVHYDLQKAICESLSGDFGARSFWCPPGGVVPRVDAATLTPFEFLRNYVAKNTPVIITGAMAEVSVRLVMVLPLGRGFTRAAMLVVVTRSCR